mgnify:FL=1
MERLMSVEDKIKRAEEIYERRHGISNTIAKVNVNEKKDVKLLKKMIIQIIVCMSIYIIIYIIQNNNFPFSQDFINKTDEILSYDTNFIQMYEDVKNQILTFLNKDKNKNESEKALEQSIGGSEENSDQNIEVGQEENTNQESNEQQNNQMSEADKEIQTIKSTTTFIKPIEGIISSKYGQREQATGNVPKNHTGTDIAANIGTKIKSATDGEVVLSSEEGDYGKHLKVQIGEVSIIYAHCNQLYVKQGDQVKQGQEIAEVGSTGYSTRTTPAF